MNELDFEQARVEVDRAVRASQPELAESVMRDVEVALRDGDAPRESDLIDAAVRAAFPDRGAEILRVLRRRCAGRSLEALRTKFRNTPRRRGNVEAPPALTAAYVDLLFAWGFKRAHFDERSRACREAALSVLPLEDETHGFIGRTLSWRIEHPFDPLDEDLRRECDALETLRRYKADRFRQNVVIIEPQEVLDPVLAFQNATERRANPARRQRRHVATSIEAARAELRAGSLGIADRLERIRAIAGLASGLSHRRSVEAILDLSSELANVTDSFNTNSHFCLAVVSAMDALILGLTGDPVYGTRPLHSEPLA